MALESRARGNEVVFRMNLSQVVDFRLILDPPLSGSIEISSQDDDRDSAEHFVASLRTFHGKFICMSDAGRVYLSEGEFLLYYVSTETKS